MLVRVVGVEHEHHDHEEENDREQTQEGKHQIFARFYHTVYVG